MKYSTIFLIFCFIVLIENQEEEKKNIFEANKDLRFCGAGLQKYNIKISPIISKKHKLNPSRKLSTVYTPIRIILDTTYFEYQANYLPLIKDKVPALKEAMKKAVKALSDFLEVEDYGNDIFYGLLTQDFFNYYKIYSWNPIFNNNANIPADLIILAKFQEVDEFPPGVLASAMPIYLYELTKRPIVGLLTVSYSADFFAYNNYQEYYSLVFLHELTHALGFLESMFPFFPQQNDLLMKKVIRGVERTLIKSPRVVERARKYFNCPTLEGLELEEQGGTGSEISHWEQRILLGDYMGAVIYQEEMVISEFTLALLEDSGWYKPKYYTGGLFRFGKNQGCEFIYDECIENNQTKFKNEFYNIDEKWMQGCSTGRQSRTYKPFQQYEYMNEKYKRFSTSYGGYIYTADYCPINGMILYESGNNYFYGNCKYGSYNFGYYVNYINEDLSIETGHPNSALPNIGEKISDKSFCIMANIVPKGKYKLYNSVFHPMCYPTYCSSKSLTIQINNLYIVCPREGGNVEVEGYDGFVNCPDYNLICTGTVLCNDIFDCIDKKSLPKNESYVYNYTPLTTLQVMELPDVETKKGYELSNDGICKIGESSCKTSSGKGKYLKQKIIYFILLLIFI